MKKSKESPRWDLNAIGPAGAIDAHVLDMLKFAKGNLEGHPFYAKCKRCHQASRSMNKDFDIGLGWLITRHKNMGELHFHNGGTGGFNSFLGIHPRGKFGVVVLTNCSMSLIQILGLSNDIASAIGFEGLQYMSQRTIDIHTRNKGT